MVRHASLFSQLVAIFNRSHFHSLVFRHKAERYSKGYNSAADWPAAWVNCAIWGLRKPPTNQPYPMPMPIDPGKCIVTFFTRR